MARPRAIYFCSACGFESPRWLGRCPQCEAWNSFDERPFTIAAKSGRRQQATPSAGPVPKPLHEIGSESVARLRFDMREFDAVVGGGTVPGSLTVIGGPPGAGKSTLLLQIAAQLASRGEVVYVCGEESAAQVKLRSERLHDLSRGDNERLLVLAETNL